MQRITPSSQFEEIVFVRHNGESFLKLYNPPTAVQMTNAGDRETVVVSQRGELNLHIRNIGRDAAAFKIMGATRDTPAETGDAYAELNDLDMIVVVPGGIIQVLIPDGPENLLSLVSLVPSPTPNPTTLRILGSAYAPWTVWKQDDQQDRAVASLDHFLQDEDPDVFYAGVWPSETS